MIPASIQKRDFLILTNSTLSRRPVVSMVTLITNPASLISRGRKKKNHQYVMNPSLVRIQKLKHAFPRTAGHKYFMLLRKESIMGGGANAIQR
jgi:hypothetical protein